MNLDPLILVLLAPCRRLAFACLLLGLCVPSLAQVSPDHPLDAVVHKAWLDDPGGSLSPQAAIESDWVPFKGLLSRGFTASTTWVRLKIDPAAAGAATEAADHRLVLRIVPVHLDEVAVWRADRLTQPPVLVGDKHPPAGPQQGLLNYAVVFDDATAPFEVLLRLRTQSNHSLHVRALRWEDSSVLTASQHSLVIGYLVFILMTIGWAAVVWLEYRVAVVGLFIAHQASALLVALLLLGVLRLYGPDALMPALSEMTSVAIALSTAVTTLFHARLLVDLGAGRTAAKLIRACAGLPLFGALLIVIGEVRLGLMLTQASILLLMPFLTVVAWRARPVVADGVTLSRSWRRAYLVGVYAVMTAAMMPQSLRVMGLMPAGPWSFFGYFAYGVASTALLSSLLILRGREERLRRWQADLVFAQARREADAQRARVAEQAELMTMLTHELKTPLTVVSLALGSASHRVSMKERAVRAVGNMRDVIERCAQAARVDDDAAWHDAQPVLQRVELDQVLAEAVGAQLHGARVETRVSKGLPAGLVDRQMLLIIVGNLLENALKYSPENSRVQASLNPATFKGRRGVALRVTNAVGLAGRPDEALAFEKYHRGPRARHRSGSGLGLYLSRRLAYRLGGELSLLEPAGDAVIFELWLPS
jgi:two-component system, sensor histidine kinase LadS